MEPITTTAALQEACNTLSRAEFVTVETEFIRETTFWPELCLIQMPRTIWPFWWIRWPTASTPALLRVMADTNIIKVFHAARQDVEIVHKLGGLIPEPLFDTQVAAMVAASANRSPTTSS